MFSGTLLVPQRGRSFLAAARVVCVLGLALFLGACTTTLRNEIRVQHDWPSQLTDKSFVLVGPQAVPQAKANAGAEADAPQGALADDYRNQYQQLLQLLRAQLVARGFVEAQAGQGAHLDIALQYASLTEPVYNLEDVLFVPHNRFWFRGSHFNRTYVRSLGQVVYLGPYFGPHLGPYLGPRLAPSLWYYPGLGFDPFWRGGPVYVYRESPFPNYQRQLRVLIERRHDHKRLFEVQVDNQSRSEAELVLPWMVESAFADFPGVSGTVRVLEREFK